MEDILSYPVDKLKMVMENLGEPSYRAEQLFSWLHLKCVTDFSAMSNMPGGLKQKLSAGYYIPQVKAVQSLSSEDGTRKYLFLLDDHNIIESVLMRYEYGQSVCISTQVGCRMGCSFCASTVDGLARNLTAGEMLSQIYEIQKDAGKITRVVLMGSGEPLDNFDEVHHFLEIISHPEGQNIGARHITLSTCGLPDKIEQIADLHRQITLAISLHGPNDQIRRQIMPVARSVSMETLLNCCRAYTQKTGRRITFEYALVEGFNDQDYHARELAGKIKDILCHVNLIPVNEIEERDYKKSRKAYHFQKILMNEGVQTTVRRRLGSDIDASCGQLRKRYLESKE